jgi:triosephosphate isomerase
MTRKKIVAGNWKMNLQLNDAIQLIGDIVSNSKDLSGVELMVFTPALFLLEIAKINNQVAVGVQNFYPKESGAFTGEISITQIKNCGASHVLIGHSERREIFHESEELIKQKVDAAILHEIGVVFCCGEPLHIRENETQSSYVKQQLIDSLFHLSDAEIQTCVIAYEPVWAIGTGRTATVDQAEEMHASIRSWITEFYSSEIANSISILYGGSCNASNAKELFSCQNVDGGLIGGASLQAESFITIARSF